MTWDLICLDIWTDAFAISWNMSFIIYIWKFSPNLGPLKVSLLKLGYLCVLPASILQLKYPSNYLNLICTSHPYIVILP